MVKISARRAQPVFGVLGGGCSSHKGCVWHDVETGGRLQDLVQIGGLSAGCHGL
jgi:hypothetical protein